MTTEDGKYRVTVTFTDIQKEWIQKELKSNRFSSVAQITRYAMSYLMQYGPGQERKYDEL